MKTSFLSLVATVIFLLGLSLAPTAKAVTCDPSELSSCFGAILYSAPVTAECCAELKAQRPCFCQYARDPNLGGYISSANAQRVVQQCGVKTPRC